MDHNCEVPVDSYLAGCGECFPELNLWYHAKYPASVSRRTLNHAKKRSPFLITINSFECATIMLSCKATLGTISEQSTHRLPHPKSLPLTDSNTEELWTMKISTSSLAGKSLKIYMLLSSLTIALLFCCKLCLIFLNLYFSSHFDIK